MQPLNYRTNNKNMKKIFFNKSIGFGVILK